MAGTLSEELLATIFSYLSAPEILTAAAVSKDWRAAATQLEVQATDKGSAAAAGAHP